MENFVERQNHTMVSIFNLLCWEILRNKKKIFRFEFMYILQMGKYWKSKRIKRDTIVNAHTS